MDASMIPSAPLANKGFQYTVAAHPTTYAGVTFRSRLEATWAAYFDLIGIRWEYEPFDLDGWTPDFLLHVGPDEILVEVKPVAHPSGPAWREVYEKAWNFWQRHWILLLGRAPTLPSIGCLCDRPPDGDFIAWADAHDMLTPTNHMAVWAEATNVTRWKAPRK